jgi:prepilin-type N-terminal cleavage/methylation domain-containing protein
MINETDCSECLNSMTKRDGQRGFSLLELMIAFTVMLIVTGGIFSLVRGSMTISSATYELTDAQENLRIAQEYINRDLTNAGDGLKSVSKIRLPETFVTNYITLNPVIDAADNMPAGIINLGILTSDNNVPASTTVTGASPATTFREGTDRQTILEVDSEFIPITPTAINSAGTLVTLPSGTDMSLFTVGEIYYLSSSLGATFGTVTGRDTSARTLSFDVGGADVCGLNLSGSSNNIKVISSSGTLPTSLQRMLIIHYYIDANKLLTRRVFGAQGSGFRDSVISEHVTGVQFKYSLETTDANGNVVQPTDTLTTKAQRLGVRQVEVTVTVETPHPMPNGRSELSMTTGTSVRNMQFRQANQPN